MNKNKTSTSIFITTSGDYVSRNTYSSADTYVPKRNVDSNITTSHSSTRYGGIIEKTRMYTPITRKHDELLSINEKLKKLG